MSYIPHKSHFYIEKLGFSVVYILSYFSSMFTIYHFSTHFDVLVKHVLSDHVSQDIFLFVFRHVFAYCCIKVVQKTPVGSFHSEKSNHQSVAISM